MTRKRVLLAPYFGFGHGLPFLTLADALESEGFEACIAAEAAILDKAGANQIKLSLPPGVMEVTEKIRSCTTTEEFAAALQTLAARYAPFLKEAIESHGISVVVVDSLHLGAALAAQASGLPWVSLGTTPFELSPTMTKGSQALLETESLRAELGLAPSSQDSLRQCFSETLHLLAWSPPFDLGPAPTGSVHVGHLGVSGAVEAELDSAVEAALASDKPKVLVTVTSSPIDAAVPMIEEYLSDAISALNQLDVSAVVTVPRSLSGEWSAAPHVHLTSFVPHDAVIPRCDLVVTNGGWGTVARTISAGVPSVLVPLFLDQPANAEACAKLGIAHVIEYEELDDEGLASAIREVIGAGSQMREVVAEHATEFTALGGAREAARRIVALT